MEEVKEKKLLKKCKREKKTKKDKIGRNRKWR